MNIETGEVKPMDQLTPAELASGKWVPLPPGFIPKPYVPKTPTTRVDFTRLQRADDRRQRKMAKRKQQR